MPSLELHGENVAPNAKAIAMAPTRVIWRQRRVGSRRSTCEDDREGQFHTQAFERYQRYEPHIAEGLTQMFVAGVSTRHPWGKSLKPCWDLPLVPAPSAVSTRASPNNLRRGESVLCKRIGVSCTSMEYIQNSSWGQGRFHPHFNRIRRGSGWKQRGVSTAGLCRGGQRWMGLPSARSAETRSNSD